MNHYRPLCADGHGFGHSARQNVNRLIDHIAKDLAPELQELLGYTMGSYALGYYSDPDAPIAESGIRMPEQAVGRGASKGFHFTAADALGGDPPKEQTP